VEDNLIELRDSNKGASRFAYDPIERLSEVLRPERVAERFIYDSTGNLVRRGPREFRYGAPDRMIKADNATLVYDNVGNLIEKRRAGSVIRYSYDSDGRLIAVETEEGGRVEFAYDAFGRRIAKTTSNGAVGFLWDGDVLLSEERSGKFKEYGFSDANYEPLWSSAGDGLNVYHTDHLGTVQEVTSELGEIVWSAEYDVYGRIKRLPACKTENQIIRFQGHYDDDETGLHYNFFRYYDPDIGRYITQDPIGIGGGINLYEYTHNPLNWVDPLGLDNKYRRGNGQFGRKPGPKPKPSTHGNAIGANKPAVLYAQFDENQVFQKWGITNEVVDPNRRYGNSVPDDWRVQEVDRGGRRAIAALERELEEVDPGPKNKVKWAGKRKGAKNISARARRAIAKRLAIGRGDY
jgi:RHS repeat-associated protein